MKEPRIKSVEPPMRVAEELPIEPVVGEIEISEGQADPSWPLPIDTAPRDGAIIKVSSGAMEQNACWRITRVRNAEKRCWDVTGWWIDPITRQKLGFEPEGWRPAEGFLAPVVESA